MGINLDGCFSICMAKAIHDDTTSTISIGWGETFQPHFLAYSSCFRESSAIYCDQNSDFFAKSLDSILGDNRV